MKNVFIWIGIALIAVSTVIGQFTGIPVASYIELAGFAIGLTTCALGMARKTEKKDWKLYVSIVGIALGSALCVLGGLVENQITTLISTVAGLVILIVSLLPSFVSKKDKKE